MLYVALGCVAKLHTLPRNCVCVCVCVRAPCHAIDFLIHVIIILINVNKDKPFRVFPFQTSIVCRPLSGVTFQCNL